MLGFQKQSGVGNIKLKNGVLMPELGLGTWKGDEAGLLAQTVKTAIDLGYRHIDCATYYRNQREIGRALKEVAVPRKDLFIVSKIFQNNHRPERVAPALDEILDELQLDYLDLLLMHWPYALSPDMGHMGFSTSDLDPVPIMDTWRAMEILVESGKVRAIGVSNFNKSILQKMLPQCRVVPAVNQVEVHPYNPEHELVAFCEISGIAVTAYCPLGGFRVDVMGDATVQAIAKAHKCTPAQVLLSWLIARGIAAIPKSTSSARLAQNLQMVPLSLDDMQSLGRITTRQRKVDPSRDTPELKWIFHESEAECPLI
ncbi:hypothetical protein H4R18_001826 [Coemansia javaensis]|uniref:NADP-dependent oxidoreductase domain-containing protein n=1 Tax=Coemansia javaensis TaxID=2761396 RepID=A0A9W8HBL1_9FUNG|nr:hypothetical protein H4R18_001826 [Coemansia javaensis]